MHGTPSRGTMCAMESTGENIQAGAHAQVSAAMAGGRAVVLLGPVGVGKSGACVEVYQQGCDQAGRACYDFIVPNSATARQVTRELLDRSPSGVLVSPRVCTFASLGSRLLARAQVACRSVSSFRRHLLLREIVDDLSQAGSLPTLQSVADTPGLTTSLDRAIAELKRSAIEPDDLARAMQATAARSQSRDLLAVYREYQQRLGEAGLFDVEGQMWQARDCLRNSPPGPSDQPGQADSRGLIIDGFTDFTPTQLEILTLLCARGAELLITLPAPAQDDGRERLWLWTTRTLERLRVSLGERLVEINVPPGEPGELEKLSRVVFDHDQPTVAAPEGLDIIAAAGVDAEVSAIARRVKKLLIDAGAAGPGKIAILARSLGAYRPAIERIFAQHDIPIAPAPIALAEIPVVRFCLALADLPRGNFEFRSVLRIIGSSYFCPGALGDFSAVHVAAAGEAIRRGNVLAGRGAYAKAVERLALQKLSAGASSDQPDQGGDIGPVETGQAGAMLQKLFDLAQAAATPLGLVELIDSLQLRQVAGGLSDRAIAARDLRAIDALAGALEQLDENATPPGRLGEALSQISLAPARGESLVDVLDVLDGRAMRWEHVFLLGLSEGQFPRHFSETSLLNEADRQAWAGQGLELYCRDDLTAREMLLFYLGISRANQTLTLSYLHCDAAGKASAAGGFLAGVIDSLGGEETLLDKGCLRKIPTGLFVLDDDEIATRGEAETLAMAELFGLGSKSTGRGMGQLAQEDSPGALRRIARGLWIAHRRWLRGESDEFDGRISDRVLLGQLARRFPGQTVFSATRLSAYGQCPWRFFAKHLLQIEPLVDPQRKLEAVSRGLLCHAVLCETLTELSQRHGLPLRLGDLPEDELLQTLERVFDAQAEVAGAGAAWPVLWEIQRQNMKRDLRNYLLAQRNDDPLASECLHFELAFGQGSRAGGEDQADRASVPEPVIVSLPPGDQSDAEPMRIRLRGRIDRVDRVQTEHGDGLMVVDYKTGRLPKYAENTTGQNTQMPLYIEAIRQLLGEDALGGAFHGLGSEGNINLFAGVKLRAGQVKEAKGFPETQAKALQTIGGFIAGMAAGDFTPKYSKASCSKCPYRQACAISPARAEVKVISSQ